MKSFALFLIVLALFQCAVFKGKSSNKTLENEVKPEKEILQNENIEKTTVKNETKIESEEEDSEENKEPRHHHHKYHGHKHHHKRIGHKHHHHHHRRNGHGHKFHFHKKHFPRSHRFLSHKRRLNKRSNQIHRPQFFGPNLYGKDKIHHFKNDFKKTHFRPFVHKKVFKNFRRLNFHKQFMPKQKFHKNFNRYHNRFERKTFFPFKN